MATPESIHRVLVPRPPGPDPRVLVTPQSSYQEIMDQSCSYIVFVYGTLKRSQPNHHYLSSAKFITEATCCEKFPLVIASKYNIPFAIKKPGSGFRIKGELFAVDEDTLAKLDELENHPTLYARQVQNFETTDCEIVEAWVYLLQEYKPEMLELQFYESYSSEGKHGKQYVASDDDLTKPQDIMHMMNT